MLTLFWRFDFTSISFQFSLGKMRSSRSFNFRFNVIDRWRKKMPKHLAATAFFFPFKPNYFTAYNGNVVVKHKMSFVIAYCFLWHYIVFDFSINVTLPVVWPNDLIVTFLYAFSFALLVIIINNQMCYYCSWTAFFLSWINIIKRIIYLSISRISCEVRSSHDWNCLLPESYSFLYQSVQSRLFRKGWFLGVGPSPHNQNEFPWISSKFKEGVWLASGQFRIPALRKAFSGGYFFFFLFEKLYVYLEDAFT